MRHGKKAVFVYVDLDLHDHLIYRAKYRGITLSEWIKICIRERIIKENQYL